MLTNVRMPEQNWGDLKAQIAAMRTGARKVTEMIDRFGLETFRAGMTELLDHAEKQARRLIEQMPDGEYFFADYMDEDSVDGHPCRLAVNMAVKGDEIEFDFSQSDPQVTASLNIPTGGNERHVLLMIPLIYVLYTMDNNILRSASDCCTASASPGCQFGGSLNLPSCTSPCTISVSSPILLASS